MAKSKETPLGSTGMSILINKTARRLDITLFDGRDITLGAYNKQMEGNVSEPISSDMIPPAYKNMKGVVCKEVLK